MRRFSLLVMLLFAAAAVAASAAPAKTAFFIRGGGWGHGIGMSQWGAYGYAVQGGTSSGRSSACTTRARTSGLRATRG